MNNSYWFSRLEQPNYVYVISEPIRPGRPHADRKGGVCGRPGWIELASIYYNEEPTLAGRFRKSSMK